VRCGAALLLAVAALGWAVPAAASETEAAFTQRLAAQFQAALPGGSVEISGPLELNVRAAGAREPHHVAMGGIWRGCLRVPATCTDETANFVRQTVLVLTESPPAVTRDLLRIAVRSRPYCAQVREAAHGQEGGDNPLLIRDLPPDLCLIVMAQYDGRRRGLNRDDLGPLGMSMEEVWQLAQRQTLAALPALPPADSFPAGEINALTALDYAPSLLLSPDAWRSLGGGAGIVVAVPSDDTIVVARLPIADAATFRQQVRTHFEQAEAGVSPKLYRWTERGWEIWAE
jgi:hypothetical protein